MEIIEFLNKQIAELEAKINKLPLDWYDLNLLRSYQEFVLKHK